MKYYDIPKKPVIRLMKSAMPKQRQLSNQAVEAVLEYIIIEIQCIMKESEKELQSFNGNPNALKENKRINGFILQRVIGKRRRLSKAKM